MYTRRIVRGVVLCSVFPVWAWFTFTEVLIDGSNEYVELLYDGTESYDGLIVLEGVKSSILEVDVSLSPGEIVVIWDSLEQLFSHSCSTIASQWLSLGDSADTTLQVLWSGGVDVWEISPSLAGDTDNTKSSLIREDWSSSVVPPTHAINTTDPRIGSPCYVGFQNDVNEEDIEEGTEGEIDSWDDNIEDSSIGSWDSVDTWEDDGWSDGESTENNQEEEDDTETEEEEEEDDPTSSIDDEEVCEYILSPGALWIQAVSAKNGDLTDEFLVVQSAISYQGALLLRWWWRGSAELSVQVDLQPWDQLVVAKESRGFAPWVDLLVAPTLSLTDGGESVTLLDERGVVLDQIYRQTAKSDVVLRSLEAPNWVLRQLTQSGTLPRLYQQLSVVSCDLIRDGDTLMLQDISVCTLPWDHTRTIQWQTVGTCEGGVSLTTPEIFDVSFVYSVSETEVCSSQIILGLEEGAHVTGTGVIWSDPSTGLVLLETWAIWIAEISPSDDYFPEYIEIVREEWVVWLFEIQWIGHWSASKEVLLTASMPLRLVVTDELIPSLPRSQQIVLSSISLTDGGETLLVRHWGQEIDTVVYEWWVVGDTSWTRDSKDQPLTSQHYTPGFTLEMVYHLLPIQWEDEFSCSIRTQNLTPFFSSNKLNLVANVAEKDISNASTSYTCLRTRDGMVYESEYTEEMRCNPWYLAFDEPGLHEVTLTMIHNWSKTCTTTTLINAPIKPSWWGWSSSSAWWSTYYQWLYKKWKWRFELLRTNIKPFGLTTNASWSVVTAWWWPTSLLAVWADPSVIDETVVRIVRLMPNPEGSDTDREQIVLQVIGDLEVDTTWRRIDTGKSTKVFPEVVLPWWVETLVQWSLGLVNSNRCIRLMSPTEVVYDTFCYGEAGDDQWMEQSDEGLEYADTQWWLDIWAMKLKEETDETCLYHEGQSILCIPLQVSSAELKQLKTDAKKTIATQKRYDKELDRRKKYQDELAQQKKKTTTVRKDYQKRVGEQETKAKNYRTERDYYKRLGLVDRGLIALWYDELSNEYSPLFVASSMDTARWVYKEAKQAVQQWLEVVTYGPVGMDPVDIDTLYAFFEWTQYFGANIDVQDIAQESRSELKNTLKTLIHTNDTSSPLTKQCELNSIL